MVNRNYQLKLIFHVSGDLPQSVPSGFEFMPVRHTGSGTVDQVNRDRFLSRVVVRSKGINLVEDDAGIRMDVSDSGEVSEATVKHVIEFCANVEGAVHVGKAQDSLERMLRFINKGQSWLITYMLKGIAEATFDGVSPLKDAVVERQSPWRRKPPKTSS